MAGRKRKEREVVIFSRPHNSGGNGMAFGEVLKRFRNSKGRDKAIKECAEPGCLPNPSVIIIEICPDRQVRGSVDMTEV